MKDKKVTGDDGVLGDALKLLGGDGFGRVTQLIQNIHETRERSKDFSEVTLFALKKNP